MLVTAPLDLTASLIRPVLLADAAAATCGATDGPR